MRSFIILLTLIFISLTVNGQVNKIEIDTTVTDVTIVNNGTLIENGTVVINGNEEDENKDNMRDWIWYALIITMVLALAIGIVCEGDGGCIFGVILLISLTIFILRYYV